MGLISVGLIYLNGAFYSALIASESSNDFRQIWIQRALTQSGLGVALVFTAILMFIALRREFSFRSSRFLYVWVVVMVLSLGGPKAREFLLVDECLDSGGAWSSEQFQCRH